MANDFSTDGGCVALYNFESGALITDSAGSNTLTNYGVSEDTSDYKQGSCSADLSTNDRFVLTHANQSSDFPFKNGESNDQVSICYWVKYLSNSYYDNYEGSISKTATGKRAFVVSGGAGGNTVEDRKHEIRIWHSSGTPETSVNFGTAWSRDVWYHVGCTFDNTTGDYRIRIWDDGASDFLDSDVVSSFTNTMDDTDAQWNIGLYDTYHHYGNFDEVVFFNRILSTSEIDEIRQGTFTGPASNWYSLNPILAADITSINGVTVDAEDTAAAGEVTSWNGVATQ